VDKLQQTEKNFKGRLIEYTQIVGMYLDFNVTELAHGKQKIYKLTVIIDDKIFGEAEHTNKKQAEQLASEKALIHLKINNQNSIIEKVVLTETPIVTENQITDSIESLEEQEKISDGIPLEKPLDDSKENIISEELLTEITEIQNKLKDENPNEESLALTTEFENKHYQ
jgi:hypothetical protein